jgi:ABC-type multidrug transport system ATPase subunit
MRTNSRVSVEPPRTWRVSVSVCSFLFIVHISVWRLEQSVSCFRWMAKTQARQGQRNAGTDTAQGLGQTVAPAAEPEPNDAREAPAPQLETSLYDNDWTHRTHALDVLRWLGFGDSVEARRLRRSFVARKRSHSPGQQRAGAPPSGQNRFDGHRRSAEDSTFADLENARDAGAESSPHCVRCGTEYHGEVIVRDVTFCVPKRGTGFLHLGSCGAEVAPLLEHVYAYFPPGKLSGIMGPSGSGKTTLLNQIGGRIRTLGATVAGEILIDAHQRPKKAKRFVGYCEQNDVLPGDLTVREALWYAAQLKLPEHLSDEERWRRVEEVIEILSLEKIADQRIGADNDRQISGGQAKRVSIALEVIGDPPIFLADEPTSGQDTRTAYSVCQALQNVAHIGGQTVIATIHQPSVDAWALFDNLVILAAGRVLYSGRAQRFRDYLMRIEFPIPDNLHIALPDYFIAVGVKAEKKEHRLKGKGARNFDDEQEDEDQDFEGDGNDNTVQGNFAEMNKTAHKRSTRGQRRAKTWISGLTLPFAAQESSLRSRRMTRERSCTASNMDNIAEVARRTFEQRQLSHYSAVNASLPEEHERAIRQRTDGDDALVESILERQRSQSPMMTFRRTPQEWREIWEQTTEYKRLRYVAESRAKCLGECGLPYAFGEPTYITSWWRQFRTLTVRAFQGEATSPRFLAYRLILVILVNPAGLATIFWPALRHHSSLAQNTAAASFVVAVASCMAIMRTSVAFLEGRALMYRERSSGAYRSSAHYLSTIAMEAPFNVLTAIVFSILDYWAFGYRKNVGAFFFFLFIVYLSNACAVGIGQGLAAIAPDITFASSFAPVVYMTFAVLAGYLLPQSLIPIYWKVLLYYANPISWAFRAILLNEWQPYLDGATPPPYLDYRSELRTLGLENQSRWTSVYVLVGIYAGARLVTYVFQRFLKYAHN